MKAKSELPELELQREIKDEVDGALRITDYWLNNLAEEVQVIDREIFETQVIDFDDLRLRKIESQEVYNRSVELEGVSI